MKYFICVCTVGNLDSLLHIDISQNMKVSFKSLTIYFRNDNVIRIKHNHQIHHQYFI
jgi:hypothetical protein